jgi:hypothetical protein
MHNAPSVAYPVGRSFFLGGLLLTLWLGGATACLLGWREGAAADRYLAVCSVALLLAAGLAARFCYRMPSGVLRWDGHAWHGPQETSGPMHLQVHLDWQRYLLVYLHGAPAPGLWLWLAAESDPAHWRAVRCAVHARVRPQRPHEVVSP